MTWLVKLRVCAQPYFITRVCTGINADRLAPMASICIICLKRYAFLSYLLALFFICFGLYTYNNAYPIYAGFDETSKIQQILDGTRNFHHPLLMVNAVDSLSSLLRSRNNPSDILWLGRTWSAFAVTLAVLLTAITAYNFNGMLAGFIVGIFLLSNPEFFSSAHLFKEDASLLFGLSLFILCASYYSEKQGVLSATAVAISSAVATSAKYIGILTLPISVVLVIYCCMASPPTTRAFQKFITHISVLVIMFLITFLLINHQILSSGDMMKSSLKYETGVLLEGRTTSRSAVLNIFIFKEFINKLTIFGTIYFALFLLFVVPSKIRFPLWPHHWLVFGFALVYGVLLTFSAEVYPRYYLPLSYVFFIVCAYGLLWLVRTIENRNATVGIVVAILGTTIFVIPYFAATLGEIPKQPRKDVRYELFLYIKERLPERSTIACDGIVYLPDPARPSRNPRQLALAQRVFSLDWELPIALAGSLQELKQRGVTHVAVAAGSYGRYFGDSVVNGPERRSTQVIRDFYLELFKTGRLLWKSEAVATVGTIQVPRFALYQIADIGTASPTR